MSDVSKAGKTPEKRKPKKKNVVSKAGKKPEKKKRGETTHLHYQTQTKKKKRRKKVQPEEEAASRSSRVSG